MKTILYLGLEVPPTLIHEKIIHCPMIKTVAFPQEHHTITDAFKIFSSYTHLLFTSRTAVTAFFNFAPHFGITLDEIKHKQCITVGQRTAEKLREHGIKNSIIADNETAEGIIERLQAEDLSQSTIFWPHSALSRDILTDWMKSKNINHHACIFYNTILQHPDPIPSPDQYDEIIFTSPSTVNAFFKYFGPPNPDKKLTFIGPITKKHYREIFFQY